MTCARRLESTRLSLVLRKLGAKRGMLRMGRIAWLLQARQAMFFDVCELLDELREASRDNSDRYYELMRSCKEVPCLVLDDMGKERTTAAGMDYLYQIVNHRYRHNLQTILTTNASDFEELSSWSSSEYVIPMISRLTGRGAWVTIKNAEDYRQREVKESAGQR